MKIINVVGARPNFMKMAPLIEEMEKYNEITSVLVHTGQHYDENMSKIIFNNLGLPKPDVYLEIGSDTHAKQTAKIMAKFEDVLIKEKPDFVIVVGDVNSTIACALTAVKMHIPVAHIEAGLRSYDREMPEEINRVLTDSISEYLFITEKSARENLLNEGISENKIYFVGNVMIDTLLKNKKKANDSDILEKLNIKPKEYALLTLHRPSNVDNEEVFSGIMEALEEIQKHIKIIYPAHPRTRQKIKKFGFIDQYKFLSEDNFIMIEPAGYLEFIKLMSEARIVLTDSGGIQEETTVLGVPCITIRENTERPVTVTDGTNIIVGTKKEKIIQETKKILNEYNNLTKIPEKWDGFTADRIIKILVEHFKRK